MTTSKTGRKPTARAQAARRKQLTSLAIVAVVLIAVLALQYLQREGLLELPGSGAPAGSGQLTSASADILLAAGLAHATDDGVKVDAQAALDVLDGIPASSGGRTSVAYNRTAQFGDGWIDTDHNGCDTRSDVLRRDLTEVELKPGTHGCKVVSGSLYSSYLGETVTGQPGKLGDVIHIDHIVALSWAWRNGADAWDQNQRIAFANDFIHLKAEEAGENTRKSDDGPAAWSPPNPDGVCEYAALFTNAVAEYKLSLPADDRGALASMLTTSCG